jgi:ATP-dependent Clp protease ATP-binding subunit ClpB
MAIGPAWIETGLPEELAELEAELNRRVIGQAEAIAPIVRAIARYRAGLAGSDRPVAAFLMLGPTGVGKTLTAEALAELLHGTPKAMLKVHCGEFRSDHELARLKGSPPGYVGWKECVPVFQEAKLREVRLRDSLAVVLFDEVEKAHPALWDLLLGLLDKGEATLNDNTRTDFRRTIILMTGNAGAREMWDRLGGGYGFSAASGSPGAAVSLDGVASRAADRLFSPEFRNRLTAVLSYKPLGFGQVLDICSMELQRLAARLRACASPGPAGRDRGRCDAGAPAGETTGGITLLFEPAVVERVAREGHEPRFGARHVKRAIERLIEEPLANILAGGRVQPGEGIVVRLADTIRFQVADHRGGYQDGPNHRAAVGGY